MKKTWTDLNNTHVTNACFFYHMNTMQDIARWAFRQEHTVDIEEIKLSRNVVFINKNKKKERKRDKTGGRNNYIDRV